MPGAYDTFNRDMAESKRRGVPFSTAWQCASRNGLDRDQRQALTGTHDAWQRAYEGRPATPPDTAPSLLLAAIRTGTRIRHDPDEDTALTDGRREAGWV